MTPLEILKIELRESQSPFFSDDELTYYLNKNGQNLNNTLYECALLKAEDDSISLPGGLSIPNNKNYWLNMARKFRPSQSGVK